MNIRKICCVVFNLCALSANLFLSLAHHRDRQALSAPTKTHSALSAPTRPVQDRLVVDGTGPVPPRPPLEGRKLVADGTGPVPPRPQVLGVRVVADGTGPVPPRPPMQSYVA